MLVLFEGPDGSGKSTLIAKIKQKFLPEALVCKRNSFKTYNPEESKYPTNIDLTLSAPWDWRFFLEMHEANFKSHNFLCDRSFITQRVYQDALGPETKTPELDATLLAYEHEVSQIPHLVVYCKRKTLRNDGDFVAMDNKELDIVARYEKYIDSECTLNKIVIDTEKLDVDSCTALIVGAIQAAYNHYVENKSGKAINIWAD
ncbi:thymidylate kinase [Chryseobacterium phage MA9V-1]|nr:thymidylate kinase [Chryseobacterium phage MA9V-1]